MICAYNSAKARSSEADKVDAENDVRSLPKPTPGTNFLATKAAFKAKYLDLDDTRAPGRSYIEKKMEASRRTT